MGYKVDYDALDAFNTSIGKQGAEWEEELAEINTAISTILGSSNMSGSGADSIKSYFNTIHGTAIELLGLLIASHKNNCFLYKRDYMSNIDTAIHAKIHEKELIEIKERIKTEKNSAIDVDEAIADALYKIRDIFYVGYKDITSVDEAHSEVNSLIDKLDENIKTLEDRHFIDDFDDTASLISKLTTFLSEQLLQGRSYKTSFDASKVTGSDTFKNLYAAYVQVCDEQQEIAELLESESINEQGRIKVLREEYEEREKKAKTIKWLVTGACIIGSILITFATAGTATPFAVGLVSAATGALMGGTNNLADQYVEHGNLIDNKDKIDWGSAAKDAASEGCIGFFAGTLSAGCANGVKSCLVNKFANSSTTLLAPKVATYYRAGQYITVGAATQTTSGIIDRGTTTYIESGGNIENSIYDALDSKDVSEDITFGMLGGYVGGDIGDVVTDSLSTADELVESNDENIDNIPIFKEGYNDYEIYDTERLNNRFASAGLC